MDKTLTSTPPFIDTARPPMYIHKHNPLNWGVMSSETICKLAVLCDDCTVPMESHVLIDHCVQLVAPFINALYVHSDTLGDLITHTAVAATPPVVTKSVPAPAISVVFMLIQQLITASGQYNNTNCNKLQIIMTEMCVQLLNHIFPDGPATYGPSPDQVSSYRIGIAIQLIVYLKELKLDKTCFEFAFVDILWGIV